MKTRFALLTALGLAMALAGGTAIAGGKHGIHHPGKGYGQYKHHSRGHGYGHSKRYSHYRKHYRKPVRIVGYTRRIVHHHGPSCSHRGYSSYRGYSRYDGYRRNDYGRVTFSGHGDGHGYYIEYDY